MSQREQDNQQARALLYAIAVLHLLCMGLFNQPSTPTVAGSQYAQQAPSAVSSLHRS